MRIGIIAEGTGDLAVIENILKGVTNLDRSNFQPLRPSDKYDETDLNSTDRTRSTWSLVRQDCIDGEAIDEFFKIEDAQYVVIHLDSDQAQEYGVLVPPRDEQFCVTIRERVVQKMNDWLDGKFSGKVFFAVAVAEIDAWLLTIYAHPQRDTSVIPNPKKALEFVLNRKGLKTTSNYRNFQSLSDAFSKSKQVARGKYLEYNCSLKLFHEEITAMWARELQV